MQLIDTEIDFGTKLKMINDIPNERVQYRSYLSMFEIRLKLLQ